MALCRAGIGSFVLATERSASGAGPRDTGRCQSAERTAKGAMPHFPRRFRRLSQIKRSASPQWDVRKRRTCRRKGSRASRRTHSGRSSFAVHGKRRGSQARHNRSNKNTKVEQTIVCPHWSCEIDRRHRPRPCAWRASNTGKTRPTRVSSRVTQRNATEGRNGRVEASGETV